MKLTLTFFAGAILSAWFSRHGLLPVATFALGSAAGALGALALGFLKPRARRITHTSAKAIRVPAPEASPIERELASALRNLGAKKPAAAQTARTIVQAHPGADLLTLVRLATSRTLAA